MANFTNFELSDSRRGSHRLRNRYHRRSTYSFDPEATIRISGGTRLTPRQLKRSVSPRSLFVVNIVFLHSLPTLPAKKCSACLLINGSAQHISVLVLLYAYTNRAFNIYYILCYFHPKSNSNILTGVLPERIPQQGNPSYRELHLQRLCQHGGGANPEVYTAS